MLLVDGDGARIEPAGELWGLSAADAEERLRERLGPAWRVAAIGPAGERLVRYATVSHDGRHAGRGGLGAVLGAKQHQGRRRARRAASSRRSPTRRRVLAAARRPARAARSAPPPPSTASSARSRTSSPSTRSTRSPRATSAPPPSRRRRGWPRRSCTSCARWRATAAPRARSAASTSTPRRAAARTRVEYENVFALGPLCGVSDPDAVLAASAPLRRPRHRHDLRRRHARLGDGVRRARPDRRALAALRRRRGAHARRSRRSARATGLGDLLAEGSRRAAEHGRPGLARPSPRT